MAKARVKSGAKAVPSVVASSSSRAKAGSGNKRQSELDLRGENAKRSREDERSDDDGDVIDLHPRDEEIGDWREEMREAMREEVRDAVSLAITQIQFPAPAVTARSAASSAAFPASAVPDPPVGGVPFEIEAGDVVEDEALIDVMKKIEASNRSNKFAIRLAGIGIA